MPTHNIASSAIVNPSLVADGYNVYRVVLRADYDKDGKLQKLYTHKQYLVKDGPTGDYFSYGYGDYFSGPDAYEKATMNFLKRSEEAMKEWPLASRDDFVRFMMLDTKKFHKDE